VLYSRRYEWLQHEAQMHNTNWVCCFGCPGAFQTNLQWEAHLHVSHSGELPGSQIQLIADSCERVCIEQGHRFCPLCDVEMATTEEYGKHAGRHLENLALIALPSATLEEASQNDDDSDDRVAEGYSHMDSYPAIPELPPNQVTFECLVAEGAQQRARMPMRVNVCPQDSTDFIVTTVKDFYGLYDGTEISFEDKGGTTFEGTV
jgi:hypothetical protein